MLSFFFFLQRMTIVFRQHSIRLAIRGCLSWTDAKRQTVRATCGPMKTHTLSVRRKPVGEHVFLQTHCKVRLSQHTCEQYVANLCCPHSQPETESVFFMEIQIFKNPPGHKPCGMRRKSFEFWHVPQPRFTLVFQNPRHATTIKHVGEITAATHFPAVTSCRILVRTSGFVTSYLGPNFVSST